MESSGDTESEISALRLKVETLEGELKVCKSELHTLQKQLNQTERICKNTESYNEDLRKQVDKLGKEIHDRKKREKNRADAEVQTEDLSSCAQSDYYHYYENYYQSTNTDDTEPSPQTHGHFESDAQNPGSADGFQHSATEGVLEASVRNSEGTAANQEESDGISIADLLRATAEAVVSQTGFVFDENSGMYYDHSTGFYYDSSSQLYYDANTGMYYYYDSESGRYQFHSRVDVQAYPANNDPSQDKKGKKRRKGAEKTATLENKGHKADHQKAPGSSREESTDEKKCEQKRKRATLNSGTKPETVRSVATGHCTVEEDDAEMAAFSKENIQTHNVNSESEPEEGEITESEKEDGSAVETTGSESSELEEEEDSEAAWPPCVRVTVVRSPVLQTGTLFIITADNPATIGREKDMQHAIRIPELGVSKFHAEVYFDAELQSYVLVDQGSQNGTVINGNRILQPKTKCDPRILEHGDEIKMGETVLSFHIHTGNDTCDGCEPGQVLAHLSLNKKEEWSRPVLNKEEKEVLRQKELKHIKVKYGLKNSDYEGAKALKNSKYKDRAQKRRQTVGSEGTFQRDDVPASVNVEIDNSNKGRKMLEKMGWKKGDGLGKNGLGRKEPVQLKMRKSQAGLGTNASLSVEEALTLKTKNQKNWEKARERFADTCQTTGTKKKENTKVKSWVRSEGE
ncbi:angiogenic factor with G patch and FHA domains 1-like [Polyodon spathula]|uniref:angiogenic factor with G patch and FHA domains 1-like n=1 Tax=Polyodon spathula TaxID=7913 RepID=UPI001B7E6DE3|nr:angiogenic factor with G patch and FHA domains 1-like [Polyodon spathula]